VQPDGPEREASRRNRLRSRLAPRGWNLWYVILGVWMLFLLDLTRGNRPETAGPASRQVHPMTKKRHPGSTIPAFTVGNRLPASTRG